MIIILFINFMNTVLLMVFMGVIQSFFCVVAEFAMWVVLQGPLPCVAYDVVSL